MNIIWGVTRLYQEVKDQPLQRRFSVFHVVVAPKTALAELLRHSPLRLHS